MADSACKDEIYIWRDSPRVSLAWLSTRLVIPKSNHVTCGNAISQSDANENLAHLVLEARSVSVLLLAGPERVVRLC